MWFERADGSKMCRYCIFLVLCKVMVALTEQHKANIRIIGRICGKIQNDKNAWAVTIRVARFVLKIIK